MTLYHTRIRSPLGPLLLVADDAGLRAVRFVDAEEDPSPPPGSVEDPASLTPAVEQIKQYFAGERREFDLPLAPQGTPFQRAAWETLRTIPFGQTISYAEQARRMDRPRAVRAVGAANGRNPMPIVVPCHRVVGRDGRLAGYSSGVEIKQALLDHERQWAPQEPCLG